MGFRNCDSLQELTLKGVLQELTLKGVALAGAARMAQRRPNRGKILQACFADTPYVGHDFIFAKLTAGLRSYGPVKRLLGIAD